MLCTQHSIPHIQTRSSTRVYGDEAGTAYTCYDTLQVDIYWNNFSDTSQCLQSNGHSVVYLCHNLHSERLAPTFSTKNEASNVCELNQCSVHGHTTAQDLLSWQIFKMRFWHAFCVWQSYLQILKKFLWFQLLNYAATQFSLDENCQLFSTDHWYGAFSPETLCKLSNVGLSGWAGRRHISSSQWTLPAHVWPISVWLFDWQLEWLNSVCPLPCLVGTRGRSRDRWAELLLCSLIGHLDPLSDACALAMLVCNHQWRQLSEHWVTSLTFHWLTDQMTIAWCAAHL